MSTRIDHLPRRPLAVRAAVRAWRIVSFVVFFAWELFVSNMRVLREVMTPGTRVAPAIVALETRCRTPMEVVSLANLIQLTPGTLALEVARDPWTLYVHGMFAGDKESFLEELRTLEAHLLAALRPVDDPGLAPPDRREVRA